ncbi:hypothetical protein ZWY2020_031428 [Hordeum vulgare]|nr:hypothetical protein ZWY2020_031428 [Hordeum vulgare]
MSHYAGGSSSGAGGAPESNWTLSLVSPVTEELHRYELLVPPVCRLESRGSGPSSPPTRPPSPRSSSLPVDLSDLPPGATIETLMSEDECASLVPVLTGLSSGLTETTRLVAYVDDLFGADWFDAARSEM